MLAFGLLLLLAASQSQAQDSLPPMLRAMPPTHTNCSGWPEPRMWIEAQQWWTNAGENIDTQSMHFHIGGCMPYNQTVTGVITIDVLLQLHQQHDYSVDEIYFLAPPVIDPNHVMVNTSLVKVGSTGPGLNYSCSAAQMLCMQVFRIQVDTSLVPFDCVGSLRLRADTSVLPGVARNLSMGVGYAYVPELSFKVRYANGYPSCPQLVDPNTIPEIPTVAAGFNDFPWSYTRLTLVHDALPTRPLSGAWTIRQLQAFDQRTEDRVEPVVAPVTRSFVTVDPRMHAVDPVTKKLTPVLGRIQLDVPNMIYQNLDVDTTTLLDGGHVLFFRTDAFIEPGATFPDTIPWLPGVTHSFSGGIPHPGGTSSTILTFSFRTANGNFASPPPPLAASPSPTPTPSPSPKASDDMDMDMPSV